MFEEDTVVDTFRGRYSLLTGWAIGSVSICIPVTTRALMRSRRMCGRGSDYFIRVQQIFLGEDTCLAQDFEGRLDQGHQPGFRLVSLILLVTSPDAGRVATISEQDIQWLVFGTVFAKLLHSRTTCMDFGNVILLSVEQMMLAGQDPGRVCDIFAPSVIQLPRNVDACSPHVVFELRNDTMQLARGW